MISPNGTPNTKVNRKKKTKLFKDSIQYAKEFSAHIAGLKKEVNTNRIKMSVDPVIINHTQTHNNPNLVISLKTGGLYDPGKPLRQFDQPFSELMTGSRFYLP